MRGSLLISAMVRAGMKDVRETKKQKQKQSNVKRQMSSHWPTYSSSRILFGLYNSSMIMRKLIMFPVTYASGIKISPSTISRLQVSLVGTIPRRLLMY